MSALQQSLKKFQIPLFSKKYDHASRSLRLVALMMGSQYKIQIVWDKSIKTAKTDGHRVWLPMLVSTGNDEDVKMLQGLFNHEVGHCKLTDFSVHPVVKSAFSHAIHNTFEDIYIEDGMIKRFPGTRRTFSDVEEIMIKRDMYGTANPDKLDAVNALNIAIYSNLRIEVLNHPSQSVFDSAYPQMVKFYGQELTDKIMKIARHGAHAESTKDTAEITDAIIDLLEKSKDKSEKEQEKKKKEDEQQKSGDKSGEGKPEDGKSEDGKPEDGKPEDGKPEDGKSEDGKSGDNSPVLLTPEQINSVKEALNSQKDDIKDISVDSNVIKVLTSDGKIDNRSGSGAGSVHQVNVNHGYKDTAWVQSKVTSAQPLVSRLGSKLEELFESIRDEPEWHATSGRKFHSNFITSLTNNNFRIFKKREPVEAINTVIDIEVDFSGSMRVPFGSTTRINAAWDVCFALAYVLYKQDIPFRVSGFAAELSNLKDFDSSYKSINKVQGSNSATMTHEAILDGTFALLKRPEEKRILLIITDGVPANVEATVSGLVEAKKQGLSVATVFINTSFNELQNMSTMIDGTGGSYSVASNPEDLALSVFTAIYKAVQDR